VLAQAAGTLQTDIQYLIYDGHGSTGLTTGGSVRQLTNNTGTLIAGQTFIYDAYGKRIDASSALTNLLYAGEMYDPAAPVQKYNLRSRLYDPPTGRFMTADEFPGNTLDPVSLHKYLYALLIGARQ
jgi:RHS repeat-associated protein